MAVTVGGVQFNINANVAQAVNAFNSLGGANRQLQNSIRPTRVLFGGLQQQTDGLAIAFGRLKTALAAAFSLNALKEATLLAARVENLGTVLRNVGEIAGFNASQINNIENSVKALGITTRSARQSLAQLAQAQLDLTKAAQLTRIAQDAAVIAGIDSSEAFNRLVVSIERNDVRLLRNLGIVINLNQIYGKFAQTTGRTAASLTAMEKRQLLLNEVIDRGRLISGTYEESLGDVFKRFTSMRRLVEEATVAFGQEFLPIMEVVVDTTSKFLKDFTAGKSLLSAKGIISIGAGAVAFGTLAVAAKKVASAIAGVVASVRALGLLGAASAALGGPLGIGIAAISALVAGGTAAWVNYKLEVRAAARELKEAEQASRDQAQAIVDAQDRVRRAQGFVNQPADLTEEALLDFQALAAQIAQDFPKLAKDIDAAIRQGTLGPIFLVDLLREKVPEAFLSSEEAAKRFEHARLDAEADFRAELAKTIRLRNEANANLNENPFLDPNQRREINAQRLREARARAQAEINAALEQGAEAAARNANENINNSESLRNTAKAFLEAKAAAEQFRVALLFKEAQEFDDAIQNLQESADQAANILNKLRRENLRAFGETNVSLLRDFEENQAQLIQVQIRTEDELIEIRDKKRRAAEEANRILSARNIAEIERQQKAETITLEEANKRREQEQARYFKRQQSIAVTARDFVESSLENQSTALKAQAENLENVTLRLEQQEEATQDLLDLARLEANHVDPELIRIRRTLFNQQRRLRKAIDETAQAALDARAELIEVSGLPVVEPWVEELRKVPDEIKNNLQDPLNRAIAGFVVANTFHLQNVEELRAREAKLQEEFNNRIEERRKRAIEEEKRLMRELVEVRQGPEAARLLTFEGLRDTVKEFEEGKKKVSKFFRELETAAREKGAKGFRDLRTEFDRFTEVLKKAGDSDAIMLLEEEFKKATKNIRDAAKKDLKAAKDDLENFRKVLKPKALAEGAEERQREFETLVQQGVSTQKATEVVERKAAEQRKQLKEEEKKKQQKVNEQQKRQRELATEALSLEERIAFAMERQTKELERQRTLRRELEEKRRAEVSRLEGEIGERRETRGQLDTLRREGVNPENKTPTPPAANPDAPRNRGSGLRDAAKLSADAAEATAAEAAETAAAFERAAAAQEEVHRSLADIRAVSNSLARQSQAAVAGAARLGGGGKIPRAY